MIDFTLIGLIAGLIVGYSFSLVIPRLPFITGQINTFTSALSALFLIGLCSLYGIFILDLQQDDSGSQWFIINVPDFISLDASLISASSLFLYLFMVQLSLQRLSYSIVHPLCLTIALTSAPWIYIILRYILNDQNVCDTGYSMDGNIIDKVHLPTLISSAIAIISCIIGALVAQILPDLVYYPYTVLSYASASSSLEASNQTAANDASSLHGDDEQMPLLDNRRRSGSTGSSTASFITATSTQSLILDHNDLEDQTLDSQVLIFKETLPESKYGTMLPSQYRIPSLYSNINDESINGHNQSVEITSASNLDFGNNQVVSHHDIPQLSFANSNNNNNTGDIGYTINPALTQSLELEDDRGGVYIRRVICNLLLGSLLAILAGLSLAVLLSHALLYNDQIVDKFVIFPRQQDPQLSIAQAVTQLAKYFMNLSFGSFSLVVALLLIKYVSLMAIEIKKIILPQRDHSEYLQVPSGNVYSASSTSYPTGVNSSSSNNLNLKSIACGAVFGLITFGWLFALSIVQCVYGFKYSISSLIVSIPSGIILWSMFYLRDVNSMSSPLEIAHTTATAVNTHHNAAQQRYPLTADDQQTLCDQSCTPAQSQQQRVLGSSGGLRQSAPRRTRLNARLKLGRSFCDMRLLHLFFICALSCSLLSYYYSIV
ncbi:hypothetical protein MP228_001084 [Amoeboaphelidium protococcarum]|nr:hypothetical protein MP228_001084 [Amoeboaphelidium protococcarum]